MTSNYSQRARELVLDIINANRPLGKGPLQESAVFVVWFCETLQNWKALISTTEQGAFYYEVTHNGDTGETYVDIYAKTAQVIVEPIEGAQK